MVIAMIRKTKIAVIREELIALTGDLKSAVLLGQFVYWAECKMAADAMYAKELEMYAKEGKEIDFEPCYGWIYKSSTELSEETLLGLSPSNIRKYVKALVDRGFLKERRNPNLKWDRTMQYNVNLNLIQSELNKMGYSLAGYTLASSDSKNEKNDNDISEAPFSKTENESSESENQSACFRQAIPKSNIKINTKSNTNRESTKDIQKQSSLSYMANNGYVKSAEDAEKQEHYFKLFWQAYPKKVNQSRARYAWESVPIDVGVYGDILRAVEAYSKSRQWQDKMYVPNAENFIADRRWEDEIPIEDTSNKVIPKTVQKNDVTGSVQEVLAMLRARSNES